MRFLFTKKTYTFIALLAIKVTLFAMIKISISTILRAPKYLFFKIFYYTIYEKNKILRLNDYLCNSSMINPKNIKQIFYLLHRYILK
jgi:hypothetical protein